jgi:hypothetical protein
MSSDDRKHQGAETVLRRAIECRAMFHQPRHHATRTIDCSKHQCRLAVMVTGINTQPPSNRRCRSEMDSRCTAFSHSRRIADVYTLNKGIPIELSLMSP